VALWLDNDEGYYKAMKSLKPAEGWDEETIKDAVMGLMPTGTPDFDEDNNYSAVAWAELVEHFNADDDEDDDEDGVTVTLTQSKWDTVTLIRSDNSEHFKGRKPK